MIIAEIFARIDVDQLAEDLKKSGKTKLWGDLIEACEIYGLKHYARADKNLKNSFYLQYVMSQITLQAETSTLNSATTAATLPKDKKRNLKAKSKKGAKESNLF